MIKPLLLVSLLLSLAACSQAPAPLANPSPTAQSRIAGPGEYLVKRGDTLYRIARENGLDHVELAALNNIDNPSALREGQILRLRPATAAATPSNAQATSVASPIGIDTGVESRPLDATPTGATVAVPAKGAISEPRGGKEPYSDEAYARLNKLPAAAPASTPAAVPATPPATPATAEAEAGQWVWPSAAALKAGYNGSSNKGVDFGGKAGDPVQAAADGKVLYVGDALAGYGRLVIVKHSTDILSVYAHNRRILVKEGQTVKRGQKIAEMGDTGTDSVKLHFEIRKQGKPVDPTPFLPKR